jgi:hypothetical protein
MNPDDIIALCTRKAPKIESVHLNVRISKDDAVIYQQLCKATPSLTDSQRIRDSVRVSTFLVATGSPVIEQLGVFK